MIDHNIWTKTLPGNNKDTINKEEQLNPEVWTNSLPKKKPNNTFKKYSLLTTVFIVGLIFVSVIKNETRNLEKELIKLQAQVDKLKFELYQAKLDHEVITSPENISKLANEYLDLELDTYKKNQIKNLDENYEKLAKLNEKKNKIISKKMKAKIVNKIAEKKVELQKLQEIYSNPDELPEKLRTEVESKIVKTKEEIKNLYSNPKDYLTEARVQRWAFVQVFKAFLGMPIIPGK